MHPLATTGTWTISDAWGAGIKAVQDTCPKETHKCYTPDKFFGIPNFMHFVLINVCSACKCHQCFRIIRGIFCLRV